MSFPILRALRQHLPQGQRQKTGVTHCCKEGRDTRYGRGGLVSGLVWRRAQVCDADMQGFVGMGRAPRRDPALPMSDSLARHDDGLVCRGLQRGRDGDSILCAAEKCRLYLWFMKVLAPSFPFFCRTVSRYFSRKLWLHSLLIHQIHRPCLWHFCCWSSRIIGVHICAIPPERGAWL